MRQKYFVSWAYFPKGNPVFGFGQSDFTVNGPMTLAALDLIRERLEEDLPGKAVVILNFQLLETLEADTASA